METGITQAAFLVEIMKATRSQWLTRGQLALLLDETPDRITRWVAEMEAQGLLVQREGLAGMKQGQRAMMYRLAPEWGGPAC